MLQIPKFYIIHIKRRTKKKKQNKIIENRKYYK